MRAPWSILGMQAAALAVVSLCCSARLAGAALPVTTHGYDLFPSLTMIDDRSPLMSALGVWALGRGDRDGGAAFVDHLTTVTASARWFGAPLTSGALLYSDARSGTDFALRGTLGAYRSVGIGFLKDLTRDRNSAVGMLLDRRTNGEILFREPPSFVDPLAARLARATVAARYAVSAQYVRIAHSGEFTAAALSASKVFALGAVGDGAPPPALTPSASAAVHALNETGSGATVAGHFTAAVTVQDRYPLDGAGKFHRWRWQLGAAYSPPDGIADGSQRTVFVRYRIEPRLAPDTSMPQWIRQAWEVSAEHRWSGQTVRTGIVSVSKLF